MSRTPHPIVAPILLLTGGGMAAAGAYLLSAADTLLGSVLLAAGFADIALAFVFWRRSADRNP